MTVTENEIKGTALGKEITISEETLSATTGCKCEGVRYVPNQKLDYEGDVSRSLLANRSHQGKLISSQMTDKARVIHKF